MTFGGDIFGEWNNYVQLLNRSFGNRNEVVLTLGRKSECGKGSGQSSVVGSFLQTFDLSIF